MEVTGVNLFTSRVLLNNNNTRCLRPLTFAHSRDSAPNPQPTSNTVAPRKSVVFPRIACLQADISGTSLSSSSCALGSSYLRTQSPDMPERVSSHTAPNMPCQRRCRRQHLVHGSRACREAWLAVKTGPCCIRHARARAHVLRDSQTLTEGVVRGHHHHMRAAGHGMRYACHLSPVRANLIPL